MRAGTMSLSMTVPIKQHPAPQSAMYPADLDSSHLQEIPGMSLVLLDNSHLQSSVVSFYQADLQLAVKTTEGSLDCLLNIIYRCQTVQVSDIQNGPWL